MNSFLLLVLGAVLVIISSARLEDVKNKFDTATAKLNVHLIPHTHDDPGWLKTADEYYYGSNSSIYNAGVQYILTTVVDSLLKNSERNFVYVEMSFFQRWYFEQSPKTKETVKSLVKNGQLSFANGGWVMHDEAGSHFMSMIDQTTLGHRFLKEEFDYTPRVGWQIDPFGHSNTHASLLSAEVGYDGLFFGRIDYADIAIRKNTQTLEFIWKGSKSQPYDEVFTGVFSDGNYGYPKGFCFDQFCSDTPVMDDPNLEDYNVDDIVARFADAILMEKGYTAGNNIALKMGSDFHYQNAEKWFTNLDKIVKLVNERDPRFNLFYSNPTQYIDAKAKESLIWTDKTDDFFPYADCEHCYWAGYFTSRPTLKYFERISSTFLQTCKQFSALPLLTSSIKGGKQRRLRQDLTTTDFQASKKTGGDIESSLFSLTAAVGLVNHHDAITGTSKQHVAYDYIKTLDKALTNAETVASNTLSKAIFHEDKLKLADTLHPTLTVCRLAVNESSCLATQSLGIDEEVLLIAYNPQAHIASQQISVILSSTLVTTPGISIQVLTHQTSTAEEHLLAISSELLPSFFNDNVYTLVFTAENIPPMSSSNYIIRTTSSSSSNIKGNTKLNNAKVLKSRLLSTTDTHSNGIKITNGLVTVNIDPTTGLLSSISRVLTSGKVVSSEISNTLEYYISFGSSLSTDTRDPHLMNREPREEVKGHDSSSKQPSGAYIFRPSIDNKLHAIATDNTVIEISIVEGDEISEIRQVFSSWAVQVIRLRAGGETVEFEWKVGPVPIDDRKGKEIVTLFKSDLATAGKISTDSNGREFMERMRDFRPTWKLDVTEEVAGNYYPITVATYIRDESKGVHLSIISDRSQGVASINDGEVELMIHRRLTADDYRGVDENLDETTEGISPYPYYARSGEGITVSGRHYLLLSDTTDGIAETRAVMDKTFLPLTVFYGLKDAAAMVTNNIAAVHAPSPITTSLILPQNLQIITLERWSQDFVLARIAHQYAAGESQELSKDVTVDLLQLFQPLSVITAVEVTLSANQNKLAMLEKKIRWKSPSSDEIDVQLEAVMKNTLSKASGTDLKVTIKPMEVRTFLLQIPKQDI